MHGGNENIWFSHSITSTHVACLKPHQHNQYECHYFVGGHVEYTVEGKTFLAAPHSMLLLAGGIPHGFQMLSDEPHERYAVHFHSSFLPSAMRDMLLAPFYAGTVYYPDMVQYQIPEYLSALEGCCLMPQTLKGFSLDVRTLALLTQIANVYGNFAPLKQTDINRIPVEEKIVEYIDKHLTEPLSPEKIADHFYISKSQLYRRFRKATGTTVADYIRSNRLHLAMQLIEDGFSASNAATNAGFSDYSTFYRARLEWDSNVEETDLTGLEPEDIVP